MNPPSLAHGNHSRTVQQNKTSMPIHHHHQQQQFRSMNMLSQQTKNNQLGKLPKNTMKQQTSIPSSRPIFPANADLISAFLASNLVRPTATKRRTFPTVELK
jgi:hypothetical protein